MMPQDSIVVESLKAARVNAWTALVPAFDHAIMLAEEAEAQAAAAANAVQCSVEPAYPVLVRKLAAA